MSIKKKQSGAQHPLFFTLMMDEMSIKKHIQWDGMQYSGFVNLVQNLDNNSLPVATNALVIMLVPLNSNWKVPIAYYLTDGLSGEVLANITKHLLCVLHDNGITVSSSKKKVYVSQTN